MIVKGGDIMRSEYNEFVSKVSKVLPELGINKSLTIVAAAQLWKLKKFQDMLIR